MQQNCDFKIVFVTIATILAVKGSNHIDANEWVMPGYKYKRITSGLLLFGSEI